MAKIAKKSLPNVIKYLKIINFRLSFLKGWSFSDASDFCQSCMKKSDEKSSLRCNFFNLGILFLLFINMIYIVIKKINLKGGIKIKMKKMTMTFGIVNQ